MSNLTKCRDCGGQISINATSCPHCGAQKTTKGGLVGKVWAFALLTPLAGLITLAPNATNEGAGAHNFFGIITMVFILWLTKRTFRKIEEEQGMRPKDAVSPILSFIIIIPTYTAFFWAVGLAVRGAGLLDGFQGVDPMVAIIISTVPYIPFLKYFKYI